MKVVRHFHPVGQGAFYTERFFSEDGKDSCCIVYDCGTLDRKKSHVFKIARKVVENSFEKDETVDFLFISHLDSDHISLVPTLLVPEAC